MFHVEHLPKKPSESEDVNPTLRYDSPTACRRQVRSNSEVSLVP